MLVAMPILHNGCRSMFYVLCIYSFIHLTIRRPVQSFASIQYSMIAAMD